MFYPLESFVGWRYLRARRAQHFVSFISLVSLLGIALGVAALIIVMSVMNGFQAELRERILGMTAHVRVIAGKSGLADWSALAAEAGSHDAVVGVAPYVSGEGMLSRGPRLAGVRLTGILPETEPEVSEIGARLLDGSLDLLQPGEHGLLIGVGLAASLGVRPGDRVVFLTAEPNQNPLAIRPRLYQFNVLAVFEAGHFEYDTTLAITHFDDAAAVFGVEGASGVRLRLDNIFDSPSVARDLGAMLDGSDIRVVDWTEEHETYFRAVRIEKTVVFMILSIIIGVAVLNIVSTLVMVVANKRGDIAVLRTLGMKPDSITRVFMIQGLSIGVFGTLLGVLLGVTAALNVDRIVPFLERSFGFKLFPGDVYYITDVPSELQGGDLFLIVAAALTLAFVSTIYPARRAATTDPAEALRYE